MRRAFLGALACAIEVAYTPGPLWQIYEPYFTLKKVKYLIQIGGRPLGAEQFR